MHILAVVRLYQLHVATEIFKLEGPLDGLGLRTLLDGRLFWRTHHLRRHCRKTAVDILQELLLLQVYFRANYCCKSVELVGFCTETSLDSRLLSFGLDDEEVRDAGLLSLDLLLAFFNFLWLGLCSCHLLTQLVPDPALEVGVRLVAAVLLALLARLALGGRLVRTLTLHEQSVQHEIEAVHISQEFLSDGVVENPGLKEAQQHGIRRLLVAHSSLTVQLAGLDAVLHELIHAAD